MKDTILSIGTVVLLKNSTKRVMIIGVLQKQITAEGEHLWDYSGCLYPEGYIGPEKTFLFNHDQIEKVFAIGYQDEEQIAFAEKIDEIRRELRNNQQ